MDFRPRSISPRNGSAADHNQVGLDLRRGETNRARHVYTAVDQYGRRGANPLLHILDLLSSLCGELAVTGLHGPVATPVRIKILSDSAFGRGRDMRNR